MHRAEAETMSDTGDLDHRLGDFFFQLEACFHDAARRTVGPTRVDHRMAGQAVRIQFASETLLTKVGRAFAHLRRPLAPATPDLTVSVWDSRLSGVPMPRPPWSLADYTARGEIRRHHTRRFRVSYQTHSGIFNMIDLEAGRAMYWIGDGASVPAYAQAAPLLPILHWWMAQRGIQFVHAGVVGTSAGAVLLAGQGGSGKSNTTLSALESGFQYLSDDFSLVQLDPSPRAHSAFCTGRVHAADLEGLSFLKPFVSNAAGLDQDKALFYLSECFPEQLTSDLPLRAILLPRVKDQEGTTWESAPPASAHRALTAVTLHQLPGAGEATLQAIAGVVRALPRYFLNLGTDRRSTPLAIRAILEEAS